VTEKKFGVTNRPPPLINFFWSLLTKKNFGRCWKKKIWVVVEKFCLISGRHIPLPPLAHVPRYAPGHHHIWIGLALKVTRIIAVVTITVSGYESDHKWMSCFESDQGNSSGHHHHIWICLALKVTRIIAVVTITVYGYMKVTRILVTTTNECLALKVTRIIAVVTTTNEYVLLWKWPG
jgi:hypothetical protein